MAMVPFEDRVDELIDALTEGEIRMLIVAAEEDEMAEDDNYSDFKDALSEALLGRL